MTLKEAKKMIVDEYKGYKAKIRFDQEDNIFTGEVEGLKDSLNFYGNSVEEAKKMFRQSIDNYKDICKEVGKEPEEAH